jgi:DNA-binding CsgD family transcriptional regulator
MIGSDEKGVIVASESPSLVVGLRAIVRRAGYPLTGVVRDLDLLGAEVDPSRVHGTLIAPVNGMTASLERQLGRELARVRTVVLLPPTAVLIHAETILATANVSLLALTAEPQEIATALRGPASRTGAMVATRPLAVGLNGALSPREQEVLDLLAAGSTNGEIGQRLSVTENTVKSHLTRVYRKLGVRSRTEAITAYLESV